MFKKVKDVFSNDIGIDLGTANTLVYLKDHGIVINEPSVVAVNQKTGQIVAVGADAKQMLGRTPGHIKAIRPLVDGVISDYEVTEEMLSYLIRKTESYSKKFFGPRVVIGIPSGVTNVESRAVYDAAKSAGAREVYLVEEPMAAAIGIRLPVNDPIGSMIVDIGGGTTDIAVISLGGIVRSKNLKVAGDQFNADIMLYLKDEFKMLVGEKTAESIKIQLGTVVKTTDSDIPVRGRDMVTGLPKEIHISSDNVKEAIAASVSVLVDGVKEILETTPPEVVGDIMNKGIILSGGGALLNGLDGYLQSILKIPVYVAEDPLTAVARGTGIILDDLELYKEALLNVDGDAILR
jgi:rod shape-determining protein MreB and related proteins